MEEKRKEAESYLLYGENTKALESVRNATNQLTSLKHETPEKQKNADTLKSELDQLLLKVQKITTITPEKITDIHEIQAEVQFQHPDPAVFPLSCAGPNQTNPQTHR